MVHNWPISLMKVQLKIGGKILRTNGIMVSYVCNLNFVCCGILKMK